MTATAAEAAAYEPAIRWLALEDALPLIRQWLVGLPASPKDEATAAAHDAEAEHLIDVRRAKDDGRLCGNACDLKAQASIGDARRQKITRTVSLESAANVVALAAIAEISDGSSRSNVPSATTFPVMPRKRKLRKLMSLAGVCDMLERTVAVLEEQPSMRRRIDFGFVLPSRPPSTDLSKYSSS